MGKKRKFEVENKDSNEFGLPAKFLSTSHIRSHEKRLIIVLEGAQLETVKVRYGGAPEWSARSIIIIECFSGWQRIRIAQLR